MKFGNEECVHNKLKRSPPHLAIEGAVLDRFAEVGGVDFFGAGEVGDGARDKGSEWNGTKSSVA
jgi:hypothetical protein